MDFLDHFTAFTVQAKCPPGGDSCIKSCYQAFINLCGEDLNYWSIVCSVLHHRNLTPAHFVNLFFRSIQYILLEENQNGYPRGYFSVLKWRSELIDLYNNQHKLELFLRLLQQKDTSTTIYQRYAGPAIVMRLMSGTNPLKVADLGCGGNYGLPGIILNENFNEIQDLTPARSVSSRLRKFPFLSEGWAIDKEDPYTTESITWRHACSVYPSELDRLHFITCWETRLRTARNVYFYLADLVNYTKTDSLRGLPLGEMDYVILCTILYQLTEEARRSVLQIARELLKPSGVLIIQDFAKIADDQIQFIFNWG